MSKKGGRPRLDDPRIKSVGFKCTVSEIKKLEELAETQQITIGEFCRIKSLNSRMPKVPVPKINIEKYQELSRLSSNLNQLMKAIHENKKNTIDIDSDFIKKIYDEVSELRKDLINL